MKRPEKGVNDSQKEMIYSKMDSERTLNSDSKDLELCAGRSSEVESSSNHLSSETLIIQGGQYIQNPNSIDRFSMQNRLKMTVEIKIVVDLMIYTRQLTNFKNFR